MSTIATVQPAGGNPQVDERPPVNGLGGSPRSCSAGIRMFENPGTGCMSHFANVTFTRVITTDDTRPSCGTNSQWINRIIRTLHTSQGVLVEREACTQDAELGSVRARTPSGRSTAPIAPAYSPALTAAAAMTPPTRRRTPPSPRNDHFRDVTAPPLVSLYE